MRQSPKNDAQCIYSNKADITVSNPPIKRFDPPEPCNSLSHVTIIPRPITANIIYAINALLRYHSGRARIVARPSILANNLFPEFLNL